MPFTGEVDVSGILAKLGDPSHGLAPTRPKSQDEDIYRAAYGTIDMSTSVVLAVVPKIIWDVNGYYKRLDISAPYTPTRRELRQGFLRVEGHSSERSTYYMKQLLDPEIRAEYDAMPIGSHFHDKYTTMEQMRKLSEVAKEMSEEEGILVTVDDLMKDFRPDEELPELPPGSIPWTWGFYALKSRKYDTDPLEKWHALLAAEFTRRGISTTISIGYVGKYQRKFKILRHEDRDIFLLNERTDPTKELAETAVSKHMLKKRKGTK